MEPDARSALLETDSDEMTRAVMQGAAVTDIALPPYEDEAD